MAKDNRITLPSSGAGITRYFEDYKSKIVMKPQHVIILAIVIILLIVFLHLQGSLFG
ncbi:MAG TPA: preprotein translocase subunit Sec61beta [Candidatus Nanoarchaeia archaeon]|nr:preprotein translocase subunit Sec61beta [Candidatus Nanoarchaeia archaeon]